MKYIKSAFNYTGSKFKLLEQIYSYFPDKENVNIFWDIFTGGGSVFINSEYDKILANDIITPLVNFYKELKSKEWSEIKENLEPFILDKLDKEGYAMSRSEFNKTKNPYHFFCLVQACTNNMLRFNKKFEFNQTWGKRTYNPNTEKKLYAYWERLQQQNVKFSNVEYSELLPYIIKNDRNFVYLDPPYIITEAGYNAFWSKKLEEDLYNFMDELDKNGVKFAMSNVSIHKGKPNLFMNRVDKYNVVNLEHNYDKVARGDKGTQEILVMNY